MPVDRSQPVYPPSKGEDILATWGDDVSEHVIQRFASTGDRDAKWANPPHGAVCITIDNGIVWMYDGTNWLYVIRRNSLGNTQLQTDSTTFSLRALSDGQIGAHWTKCGIVFAPNNPGVPLPGGAANGAEWALLSNWATTNDLYVFNNIRLGGGIWWRDSVFGIDSVPSGTPNVWFTDIGGGLPQYQSVFRFKFGQRVEGPAYQTVSSIRYKDDVADFDGMDVRLIRVVRYKMKGDPDGPWHLGVIAEELIDVMPDAVSLNEDSEPNAVNYTQITMAMLSALQHALDRIDALEAGGSVVPAPEPAPEPREDRVVSALMDRIDELQAQIDALTPVEATLEVTEDEPDESLAERVAALESRPLVPVSVSDTFTLLLRRIEALENPTAAPEPEPVLAEDMETLMLRRLAELQADIDDLKDRRAR